MTRLASRAFLAALHANNPCRRYAGNSSHVASGVAVLGSSVQCGPDFLIGLRDQEYGFDRISRYAGLAARC